MNDIERFDIERLNYNLFKQWWEKRREDDPRTAITSSLARNIAIMVYDTLTKGKE